jgi:hypothetical protein
MSVKKRRKSTSSSPFTPEMAAAITKELPGVLIKEGYLKREQHTEQAPQNKPASISQPVMIPVITHTAVPRGNRRALWYAVGIFSIFIFVIWMINAKNVVETIWSSHTGAALIDKSKNDLSTILETIQQNDKIFQDKFDQAAAVSPTNSPTTTSPEIEAAIKSALTSLTNTKNSR